jgi:phosphotransferase system  glucose/maltose/N-acetylglucosamine-specific IIC component
MELTSLFGGILFLGILFVLIMVILGVLVFVFWILMLIDCINRKFKENLDKVVWVLVIIFTGIIGALIYYFIIKVKDKKK